MVIDFTSHKLVGMVVNTMSSAVKRNVLMNTCGRKLKTTGVVLQGCSAELFSCVANIMFLFVKLLSTVERIPVPHCTPGEAEQGRWGAGGDSGRLTDIVHSMYKLVAVGIYLIDFAPLNYPQLPLHSLHHDQILHNNNIIGVPVYI